LFNDTYISYSLVLKQMSGGSESKSNKKKLNSQTSRRNMQGCIYYYFWKFLPKM